MKLISKSKASGNLRVATRSQTAPSPQEKISQSYTEEEKSLKHLLLSHLPQTSQSGQAYVVTTHRTAKKAHPCNVLISEFQHKRLQAIKQETIQGKKLKPAKNESLRKPTLNQFNKAYESQMEPFSDHQKVRIDIQTQVTECQMELLEDEYQRQKLNCQSQIDDRYHIHSQRELISDNEDDEGIFSDYRNRDDQSQSNQPVESTVDDTAIPLGDFHFTKNTLRSFYPKEVQLNMIRRKFQNTDRIAKGLTMPNTKQKQDKTLFKMKQLARSQMNFVHTMMQQINRRSKGIKKEETKVRKILTNRGINLDQENCDINMILQNSFTDDKQEDEQCKKQEQSYKQQLAKVKQAAHAQTRKVTQTLLATTQNNDGVHIQNVLSPLDAKQSSQHCENGQDQDHLQTNYQIQNNQVCDHQQVTQINQNSNIQEKKQQSQIQQVDLAVMQTQIGPSLIAQQPAEPFQPQVSEIDEEQQKYEEDLIQLNLAIKRQKTSIQKPRRKPIQAVKQPKHKQQCPQQQQPKLQTQAVITDMNGGGNTQTAENTNAINNMTVDQQHINSSAMVSPEFLQQNKMLPDSLSLTPQVEFEHECAQMHDKNMSMFNFEDQYMVDVFEDRLLHGTSVQNEANEIMNVPHEPNPTFMMPPSNIQKLHVQNSYHQPNCGTCSKPFDVPVMIEKCPLHNQNAQKTIVNNCSQEQVNDNLAQIVLVHQPHSYSYHPNHIHHHQHSHSHNQIDHNNANNDDSSNMNPNIANPYLVEKLNHFRERTAQEHNLSSLSGSPQQESPCQQGSVSKQLEHNSMCTPEKLFQLQNYATTVNKFDGSPANGSEWVCSHFHQQQQQQQFNM